MTNTKSMNHDDILKVKLKAQGCMRVFNIHPFLLLVCTWHRDYSLHLYHCRIYLLHIYQLTQIGISILHHMISVRSWICLNSILIEIC